MTTLDGYLFDESPSLRTKLEDWLRKVRGTSHKALALTVRWKEAESSSSQKLSDIPIEKPTPGAVRNLLDQVRDQVVEAAGQEPDGFLTVRGVEAGNHASPGFTHQRRLQTGAAATAAARGTMYVDELRDDVRDLRALNRELTADLREVLAYMMGAMQKKDETIDHLATQRAAGSTVADAGGSWTTLIGLVAVAIGWPVLKESFGIPKSASIPESMTLIRAKFQAAMGKARGDGPPPAGTYTELAEGEAPKQLEDKGAAAGLVESLLGEAEGDPAVVGQVIQLMGTALQDNTALAAKIVQEHPWILSVVQAAKQAAPATAE